MILLRQVTLQLVKPSVVCRSSFRFSSSSSKPKPPTPSYSYAWQFGTVLAVVGSYVVAKNIIEIAKVDDSGHDDEGELVDKVSGKPFSDVTSRVFFDISVDGYEAGRVVLGLYGNAAPKTVLNFETLANGETRNERGLRLAYEGSTIHRIIPQFMIQGGDFTNHNGTGGFSIYGDRFDDEQNGLKLKHSGPGILSMANSGRNTNGSQFFITTVATPWLNGRHVVFGKVCEGMDVIQLIDKTCGSPSGAPRRLVKIERCGVLPNDESN